MKRPLVAIPARRSLSASALRFEADVAARKLLEAVFEAGGEPLIVHPVAPNSRCEVDDVRTRFGFVDAILLPGGGDVTPALYGGRHDASVYDADAVQDAFDLAVARWAIADGIPLLAICRGMQVVNVALGGSLVTDMHTAHRHVSTKVDIEPQSLLSRVVSNQWLTVSCYHHQVVDRLGEGLRSSATTHDGLIEAVELADRRPGWFLGVQWHPEDTAGSDPLQTALFTSLIEEASLGRIRTL